MAVPDTRLMPLADTPRRKSDGTFYTDEDREAVTVLAADGITQTVQRLPYFELASNGGVRRYVFAPYPAMLYQAYADASAQGKVTLRHTTVVSEQEQRDREAVGWHARQEDALEAYEQAQRDIARAAAENAAKAQTMTTPAQAEFKARSAKTPTHLTE
jgi:hypothetical protein